MHATHPCACLPLKFVLGGRIADHETTRMQFEARLAARKFRKHVCAGRAAGPASADGAGAAGAVAVGSGSGSDDKEVEAVHAEEVAKM